MIDSLCSQPLKISAHTHKPSCINACLHMSRDFLGVILFGSDDEDPKI